MNNIIRYAIIIFILLAYAEDMCLAQDALLEEASSKKPVSVSAGFDKVIPTIPR